MSSRLYLVQTLHGTINLEAITCIGKILFKKYTLLLQFLHSE